MSNSVDKHTDRDWLQRKYWDEGQSIKEIASESGTTPGIIRHQMEYHNIERRTTSETLSIKQTQNEDNGDTVRVCPDCDGHTLRPRMSAPVTWYCPDCDATFDEPKERGRCGRSGPTRGLAKKLSDADPDEVFSDD